jgi:predicted RNase H-like HicB family nuclease
MLAYIPVRRVNLEHKMSPYHVTGEWDDEAQVWVASSEDVPGLATGAETLEGLIEKLKIVIPELLVENGLLPASTESRRQYTTTHGSDFHGLIL